MNFEPLAIAANHPSLAGHFPGNPIVPGVVILDEVIRAFEAWRPGERLTGIPVVKFLAPLRPEQSFTIRFLEPGSNPVRFDCVRDNGQVVARGSLSLAAPMTGGNAP
ncbi:MAG: acyl-CoA synthetase/AMP-acid ligase [Proteobacteria bacterium]|jgi:3-hydroxymyristoyl/3-hydroxydecanoyl-(acyl carrier protein) dehydratase|nr:acyl-CoA synthetase/AMP-acid ligase [Pseudomonadota bacterium]MBS1223737.1 acyl-CoA synthetase/AMP-acid ligase [Pseudomonadota bacterium]MBS1248135.1 acyl-CoA synthetase/AMP-acid ligase [Pseudomonadota bacterium]MCU0806492.1 hydroxymyristoyl-ACP dehydratase [Candidatus Contendobacter sp.]